MVDMLASGSPDVQNHQTHAVTENTTRLSTLIHWCTQNDINIDPRIYLVDDPNFGIYVSSKETTIPPLETLVTIPKTAVLSSRSSSLAHLIPEFEVAPYGHGALLGLALSLYYEMVLGPDSRWWGYLQSLPQEPVGIALFWGIRIASDDTLKTEPPIQQGESTEVPEDSDSTLARRWSVGTEIDREQRNEDGVWLLDELQEYYHTTVKATFQHLSALPSTRSRPPNARAPLSHPFPCQPTLAGYMRAYSLVSSRAFLVDAYHGLSMVPIADAFNHSIPNHVHLESEFDVCVQCGSLAQCTHDDVDPLTSSDIINTKTSPQGTQEAQGTEAQEAEGFNSATNDTCDMLSNLPIPPHTEIFNTYGEKLTNAQLLVRYGFALPSGANDNDVVSWKLDELLSFTFMYTTFPSEVGTPQNPSCPYGINSSLGMRAGRVSSPPRRCRCSDAEARHAYRDVEVETQAVSDADEDAVEGPSNVPCTNVECVAGLMRRRVEDLVCIWPTDERWQRSNLVFNPVISYVSSTGNHSTKDKEDNVELEGQAPMAVQTIFTANELEFGDSDNGRGDRREEAERDKKTEEARRHLHQLARGRPQAHGPDQSRVPSSRSRGGIYGAHLGKTSRHVKPVLCINGDAKLSHHLWVYCALLALVRTRTHARRGNRHGHDQREAPYMEDADADSVHTIDTSCLGTVDENFKVLSRVVALQIALEEEGEEGDMESDMGDGDADNEAGGGRYAAGMPMEGQEGHQVAQAQRSNAIGRINNVLDVLDATMATEEGAGPLREDSEGREVVRELVRTVRSLCRQRARQLGLGGQMGVEEMGEMLEGLGEDMEKTRYAIEEVVNERAILESCKWAWQEVGQGWGAHYGSESESEMSL